MDTINKVTKLNSILNQLDDIIFFQTQQKNNNPRTQLSVSFLAGRRPSHIHDIILGHAQHAHRLITKLYQNLRSTEPKSELVQSVLSELHAMVENDQNNEAHFMLGENGVLQQLRSIFPNENYITIPENTRPIQMTSVFAMVCQRDRNWNMLLGNLIKTLHSRPVHQHMHHAINALSDPSMAAFELHVLPRQILKVTTPGGPERIQLHKAAQDNIKFLYDNNYRHYRYLVTEDNSLERTEPHPEHRGTLNHSILGALNYSNNAAGN